MTFKEFNAFGLLNKLHIDKSMGPDEMHPRLPKELVNFVVTPLLICPNLPV